MQVRKKATGRGNKKGRKKRKRGKKEKGQGWKDRSVKSRKRRRVAAKMQGVGKQNSQGETRGFEVRWVCAGVGLLSRSLKIIFILQI